VVKIAHNGLGETLAHERRHNRRSQSFQGILLRRSVANRAVSDGPRPCLRVTLSDLHPLYKVELPYDQTADRDIAVAGEALEDANFSDGSDRIRYSIDPGTAQGPFRVEAESCYQPIGYRWAINLKGYNAEEPQRFSRYYEAASASSMQALARAYAGQ
jgi:hypothetical protein